MHWRGCVTGATVLAFTLGFAEAEANEPLVRTVDWRGGAPMSRVNNLDQDADGYLWLATPQGLIRYDGAEFRSIDAAVGGIVRGCGASGRVRGIRFAGDVPAEIVEVDGASASVIPLPGGAKGFAHPVCSDDGSLWIELEGALWRKRQGEDWTKTAVPNPAAAWDGFWPGRHGALLGKSGDTISLVTDAGATPLVSGVVGVIKVIVRDDGDLALLTWRKDGGHLLVAHGAVLREVTRFPGRRPIGLVERSRVLWVTNDGGMVGIAPDGTMIDIPVSTNFPAGGPVLLDREGALWVFANGLYEFPEPETYGLDRLDLKRFMVRVGGERFASSWHGSDHIVQKDGRWTQVLGYQSIGAICEDARGRVWGGTFDAFFRTEPNGRPTRIPIDQVGDLRPCALDRDGTLWMPTLQGLYRLPRERDVPILEPIPSGAGDPGSANAVLLDHDGRLWVGMSGRVCSRSTLPGEDPSWRCESLPVGGDVTGLVETDRERIWAASNQVYERDSGGGWNALTLARPELIPPAVCGLTPSPSGGVWLLGSGAILRVAGEAREGRLTVLERLGGWQGVPTANTSDAMEDEDGTLWLAADTGLVRVPPGARSTPRSPQRVLVTDMTVDGHPVRLDQVFRSPYRRNRIEAQVSAFSYRDPSLVRYRFRIRDGDPWSEPTRHTTFQFYNLTSGRYALRFAASLDGVHWTETPSAVRFAIDRPWFGQWWFLALVFIALAAAVWTVHRVRVVRLVALAEQRTRIAMDLHDAIGSGLGSIGLLAGIGARPATNAERRRDLSGQVAKMAGELGTSLSEIVWSLRPGSETLASLAQYLRERANATFLETGARFVAEFPETWPDVRLSLTARRNLLLIVLEALHNAAAHAEATEVRLGIASRGSSWALWVQDDGVGIKHGVRPGGGMGTENMKRRAAEIGATLEWSGRAPRGTVVTLILDPSSISA